MTQLIQKQCTPCQGGAEPLKGEDVLQRIEELQAGWSVVDEHHLQREFTFDNFRQGLDFVNQVGELAEEEGHHPNLLLTYGKVVVHLWSHKIDGLHENDFILAAKIDALSHRPETQ
jgi:4a-hydroxytetrahydrobiopterin dehydratase